MNIYYENSHHVCFGLCMVNIDISMDMVELFVVYWKMMSVFCFLPPHVMSKENQ